MAGEWIRRPVQICVDAFDDDVFLLTWLAVIDGTLPASAGNEGHLCFSSFAQVESCVCAVNIRVFASLSVHTPRSSAWLTHAMWARMESQSTSGGMADLYAALQSCRSSSLLVTLPSTSAALKASKVSVYAARHFAIAAAGVTSIGLNGQPGPRRALCWLPCR